MPVLRRVLALLAAMLLAAPVALADPMPVTGQGHVQNLGWMAPTSQTIGTTGRSLRLEALRLSGPVYVTPHVQGLGWLRPVDMLDGDGVYAGTTGRSLRLEAVKITMAPVWADSGGHVEYQCHVQDIGWMPWVRDGAVCGTTGRSLRLEAIRVRHVPPTATTPTPEPTATPTPTATATPPAEGTTSIAVTAVALPSGNGNASKFPATIRRPRASARRHI